MLCCFCFGAFFGKLWSPNPLRAFPKTCCLKMLADFRDGKTANFPFREEKENRNTDRSRGFLPVLWPERCQAGSDSEVFRSALKRLFWLKNCKIKKNIVE